MVTWPVARLRAARCRGSGRGRRRCAETGCDARRGPRVVGAPARSCRTAVTRSMSSIATIRCLGAAMLMQCASEGPPRFVLSSATTPPTRVMPSQTAMYSGRFGIKRQTASPLAIPCAIAHRAYWVDRSASARYVRHSTSERSAGASPAFSASSSMTVGRMRSGRRTIGAVSSSARDHALTDDGLPGAGGTPIADWLRVITLTPYCPHPR